MSSITIYSAEFFIQGKSNYKNYFLRLVADVNLSTGSTKYIVLKQKTPIKGGSEFNYLYGYFEPQKSAVTSEDGKFTHYVNLSGPEEKIYRMAQTEGKDISFPMSAAFDCALCSDVPYDIYIAYRDYDTGIEILSNVMYDVRTPYINMQCEYLHNYIGMEQTLKPKSKVTEDDFCMVSQGVYYPVIRSQTVYYAYPYTAYGFGVQSCVACAAASAMEYIYYKLTGAMKFYSASYIYGASTDGNISSSGSETEDDDNIKDANGMYFLNAASACQCGVPTVSNVYHNKYDLPYSYCVNDQYPYEKFEQTYSNLDNSECTVTRITAKEIYEEFKNSADIPKDTLATITELYSASDVKNSEANINILKRLIKWDTGVSNTAVIIHTEDFNNTYGSDGVVGETSSARSINSYSAAADGLVSSNHAMLIVGWLYYDGKLHWICHNSWGKSEGDNGKIYMPVDYSGIISYYQVSGLSASRPDNWVWCTDLSGMEISGDGNINGTFDLKSSKRYVNLNANDEKPALLSVAEWNMFCMRINEFRYYKGLEKYSFETVSENFELSAQRFNAAVNAVKDMSGYITEEIPNAVVSGAFIYRSDLDGLAAAINSIK